MKQWQIVIVMLLLCIGLFTPIVSQAERDRPVRIGALTASWGPTPMIVGLRDGLQELGYREVEDFVLGVRFTQGELSAKRLELFQKMVPNLQRILVPYDANSATALAAVKAYRDAAQRLGIVILERPLRTMQEAQATLAQVHKGEVDGIVQWPSAALNIAGFILEATTQRGIPAIFAGAFWAERGALATYGPDFHKTGRQAARLVDKILKGGDPATIPVEVNSDIDFVINLKTAQALGLTIPPEILFQATKVIR